jgi:hypothetical protein
VNVVDEVELAWLEYTGSVEVAEHAGQIVREQLEFAAYLCGSPVEEFLTYWEAK